MSKETESIREILINIAKESDIHESVYKKYIRRYKVDSEQVGDNININEEENTLAAAEPEKNERGAPSVRIGTFLTIHDDYFQWNQQTRITNNKDLQAHAHSNERKAKRRLDIERAAINKARDALEREQSRLLGREAQFGNQLWAHVRQEGEHRRAFDECISKSAIFKQIAEEAAQVELVSTIIQIRTSSSEPWNLAVASLKEGLFIWKGCDDTSVCGEVSLYNLKRLVAYPPYTGVSASPILFASCRIEPTSSSIVGRCYGREVIVIDWGEGSIELAPLFEGEMGRHVSLDSSSRSSMASHVNEERVCSCQQFSHLNTSIPSGFGRCESCVSVSPPPPPPPPRSSRPERGIKRSEVKVSESFEVLISSLEFVLAVKLDQQLPLLGTLVDCPSLLKVRQGTNVGMSARKRALSSREPVIVQLSMEGRTSSEASSLSASSVVSWSPSEVTCSEEQLSVIKASKSIDQVLEERLTLVAAKLGMTDNARYQLRCANIERTEAQASILRSVSRREKTLELLATLKQLQDICRKPPLEGRNGKWMTLPNKRAAVLSEVGRRLSQALETTSIPDLWSSSANSNPAMTSWPPIQNMHVQENMPMEACSPVEDRGMKGRGSMSSVEMLRRKKRSAAEKRRQSHVRFLRNGVDDFAVEPNKLQVCSLIYEYQSENMDAVNTGEVAREHPELSKEFERLRGLVSALWEQQSKFMEVAHALARERALLLWYIDAGRLLSGEASHSFASGSLHDLTNPDAPFSSPSLLSLPSFYSPSASFCEEETLVQSKSMSNIGDFLGTIPCQSPCVESHINSEKNNNFDSPLEPKTLKYINSPFIKEPNELPDIGSRPIENVTSVLDHKEDELYDVEF